MANAIKTSCGVYREVLSEELIEAGDADLIVGTSVFYPLSTASEGQPSYQIPCFIHNAIRVRRIKVAEPRTVWAPIGSPLPFRCNVLLVDLAEKKILIREAP